MKKYLIILVIILSMTAFGQSKAGIFGRVYSGDVFAMMKSLVMVSGESDTVEFTKGYENVKVLSTFSGSGLCVVINNREVFIGNDEPFKCNGKSASPIVLIKDKSGKDNASDYIIYLIPIREFQVGGKIAMKYLEADVTYLITDRDVRRMKQMILKRDLDLSVMDVKVSEMFYLGDKAEWEAFYLKSNPERDLGE